MTEENDIDGPDLIAAFDGEGRPVAVTHPVYETADGTGNEADTRSEFTEKLNRFLQWLVASGSAEKAGRTVFLIAHMAGQSGCKSDAELARKLNISAGRLSQLRADISRGFESLDKCNRRQN
jgi:hypothetical protein